jgi:hypothetical protein
MVQKWEIPSQEVERRNPSAEKVSLRRGDVFIEFDGLKATMTKAQFLAYLIQRKKPGQKVGLTYLGAGRRTRSNWSCPRASRLPETRHTGALPAAS